MRWAMLSPRQVQFRVWSSQMASSHSCRIAVGPRQITSGVTQFHQDSQNFTAAADVVKCIDPSDFATNIHL